MRTPVPKCLQKKKILGGIFIHLTFLATTGKPHPPIEAKKTMTVVALVTSWSHGLVMKVTYRRHQHVEESRTRPHPPHYRTRAFPFRRRQKYNLGRKVSRGEMLTLPKLARSFVAGDDGRTKRREVRKHTTRPLPESSGCRRTQRWKLVSTRLGTDGLSIVVKVVVA